jgi:hypothetical protein
MAKKQFKDGLELNGSIQVGIQVALVVQAISEYVSCEWSAPAMNQLMTGLQEEIMDPIYIREWQARMQQQQDQQEEVINRFTGLNLPGRFPFPDAEDEK